MMCDLSDDFFVFQQDSAPARDAVPCLEQSTPTFIPPDLYGRQIAPTLIWSITRDGVTSSSDCISRSCTASTNLEAFAGHLAWHGPEHQ